jgi:hypothetical protein
MKEGLPGGSLRAVTKSYQGGLEHHVAYWLDLSCRRLDYDLLCEDGSRIERGAAPPDGDGLRGPVDRVAVYREPVCAAIESMNGARFVHDRLEELGWRVEIDRPPFGGPGLMRVLVLVGLACGLWWLSIPPRTRRG